MIRTLIITLVFAISMASISAYLVVSVENEILATINELQDEKRFFMQENGETEDAIEIELKKIEMRIRDINFAYPPSTETVIKQSVFGGFIGALIGLVISFVVFAIVTFKNKIKAL